MITVQHVRPELAEELLKAMGAQKATRRPPPPSRKPILLSGYYNRQTSVYINIVNLQFDYNFQVAKVLVRMIS